MIRINLLPVRQTRKVEALRRELTVGAVIGAIILAVCMLFYIGARVQMAAVGAKNQALQAEIGKLQEDVKRVDEMEKFKQELEKKLAVIAELRSRKSGPVHMLDDLAIATPEKLTIKSLTENSGNITITGVAVSNEVISQFLRALDNSEYFEQVYLVDIEAKAEKGVNIVMKAFKLTAKMSNPELDKAKAAAKGKGGDKAAPAPAAPAAPAAGDAAAPPAEKPAEAAPAPVDPKPAAGGGA